MTKESNVENSKSTDFYKQLFKKVALTTIMVIALSLSYTLWIVVDSDSIFLLFLIVSLAFLKTTHTDQRWLGYPKSIWQKQ